MRSKMLELMIILWTSDNERDHLTTIMDCDSGNWWCDFEFKHTAKTQELFNELDNKHQNEFNDWVYDKYIMQLKYRSETNELDRLKKELDNELDNILIGG